MTNEKHLEAEILRLLAERGAGWPVRIAGGLATALLGAIVIALKVFFH